MEKFAIPYERFFRRVEREALVFERPMFVELYNDLKDLDPNDWKIQFLLERAGIIASLQILRLREQYAEGDEPERAEFKLLTYELAQKGAFFELLTYVFEDMGQSEKEAFFQFLCDFGYMNEGTK